MSYENGKLNLNDKKNRIGRGAYVCPKPECVKAAWTKEKLARALKTKLDSETLKVGQQDFMDLEIMQVT